MYLVQSRQPGTVGSGLIASSLLYWTAMSRTGVRGRGLTVGYSSHNLSHFSVVMTLQSLQTITASLIGLDVMDILKMIVLHQNLLITDMGIE